jgi:hypothetical protein
MIVLKIVHAKIEIHVRAEGEGVIIAQFRLLAAIEAMPFLNRCNVVMSPEYHFLRRSRD